jgi:xanthine dehydrogenase iron-sulfur cluster and FAD-binding subunit A
LDSEPDKKQTPKEYLFEKLTMLSYACISGECGSVESLVGQLAKGNYGPSVNKALDSIKGLVITFDYEHMQKIISKLDHDLSTGVLVIDLPA